MNDERRKKLQTAINNLDNARNLIEEVKQEEEDALEAMPDAFKEGEKGEKAQTNIDALESAMGSAEDAVTNLEEAMI